MVFSFVIYLSIASLAVTFIIRYYRSIEDWDTPLQNDLNNAAKV